MAIRELGKNEQITLDQPNPTPKLKSTIREIDPREVLVLDQEKNAPSADFLTSLSSGAAGAGEGVLQTVSGITRAAADVISPYIPDAAKIVPKEYAPSVSAQKASDDLDAMKQRINFTPTNTAAEVFESPSAFAARAPLAILENAPSSLPYLAASLLGPAGISANLMAVTGQVAEDRSKAKGEVVPSPQSVIESIPFGAASAALDRFGALKMINPSVGNIITKPIKAGLTEFGTEATQSVIEQSGSLVGTDKKFDATQMAQEAGLEGLVGFGVGGATNAAGNITGLIRPAVEDGQTNQNLGTDEQQQAAQQTKIDVLPNRDDLAAAIKNNTAVPESRTIELAPVDIDPALQQAGFVQGAVVEQTTERGDTLGGAVVSAQVVDNELEVTVLDQNGQLKTLFSSDGDVSVILIPQTAGLEPQVLPQDTLPQENIEQLIQQPPVDQQMPQQQRPSNDFAVMNLEQLTNVLQSVKAQAKQSGINRRLLKIRDQVTKELDARFPEWDIPKNIDLAQAAQDVNLEPTDAQKEAGNYSKGSVSIQGLPITLENPKGSLRKGKDKNGTDWEVSMPAHYGYIKRTEGADGERIDVYVGDRPSSDSVFVLDQIDLETKSFDEHKVFVGFDSEDQVKIAYRAAFSDGRAFDRYGGIKSMTMPEFKDWLKNSNNKKPVVYKKPKPTPPAATQGQVEAKVGQVGMKLGEGEVVLTNTGRQTTPFPKIGIGTPRKTTLTVKRIQEWLLSNALAEAEARGDTFNARQFKAEIESNQKEYPQATLDSAELYLFDVPRSILKPLTDTNVAQPSKPDQEQGGSIEPQKPAALDDVNDTNVADMPTSDQEPPKKTGMVRVYHSGSVGEGETGRWVSTDRRYASDYRPDLPLHYLDISENDPRVINEENPETKGFTFNFELTPEESSRLVMIKRESSNIIPQNNPQQQQGAEQKAEPEVGGETFQQDAGLPPLSQTERKTEQDAPQQTETAPKAAENIEPFSRHGENGTPVMQETPSAEDATGQDGQKRTDKKPRGERMQDVGEKLEGGRKFKGDLEKAKGTPQEAKVIIDGTDQAQLFGYTAQGDQTSGVERFHQAFLKNIYSFSEYLYSKKILIKSKAGRYGTKMPSWKEQIKIFFADDAIENGARIDTKGNSYKYAPDYVQSKRKDILAAAEDYARLAEDVVRIFEGAENVEQVRSLFKTNFDKSEIFTEKFRQFAKSYWLHNDIMKADGYTEFGRITDESDKKGKKGPEKKLIRPRLEKIEREDLKDYRKGRDIPSSEFKDAFGFRGVEFGNWVNAAEGQAHVNHAYDAFMDMADRLGIDPKHISLGGKLGFAFGARGAGEHAAHFEPSTNIINLTKTKGDGSLAHEWAHALDINLRKTSKTAESFMNDAYDLLSKHAISEKDLIRKVESFLKGSMFFTGKKSDGPVANARFFLNLLRQSPQKYATKSTKFQADGNDLSKNYHGTRVELFARAWEAWMHDTIKGRSPYLVNSWVAEGAVTTENGYRGTLYPVGEERQRFNQMFDDLIKNIDFSDDGVKLKNDSAVLGKDLDVLVKLSHTLEGQLGQMMKEIEDGRVQQGAVQTGVSKGDGGASSVFIPPDDKGADIEGASEGDSGRGAGDVRSTDGTFEPEQSDGDKPSKSGGGRDRVSRDDTVPARVEDESPAYAATGKNHVISVGDLSESRSQKKKAEDNIEIIKLIKEIEKENRSATPDEQSLLAKFTGWGSIKNAFPDASGRFKDDWASIGKQLKELLTEKEYSQSRRTIQYAHYTSEIVTRSMWDAMKRFGLKTGNVFEPGMGVGNFVGMMPQDMNIQYSGIEIDPMTARISAALYPESSVRNTDFISAKYADGMFDAAIGNPPFSDAKVKSDPKYKGLSLHNYFFAKTLDMVGDGGVLAFVTSRYSMDAVDSAARKMLSEKADLIGAIRLPNTAFKTNAHTEVVTDIIFLRKRRKGEESNGVVWQESVDTPIGDGNDTASINEYFIKNPEMVLGNLAMTGTMYASKSLDVVPVENKDLQQQLDEAINRLPEGIVTEIDRASTVGIDFSPAESKDGSYYIKDGALMQVENGIGQPAPMRGKQSGGLTKDEAEKIKKLIPIRDALRNALNAMVAQNNSVMRKEQDALTKAYDDFVKKYGPITKSETKTRPAALSQLEEARDEMRNDYIAAGEEFNEGDIDLSHLIGKKDPNTGKRYTAAQIASMRQQKRAELEADGKVVDEGDFDPSSVPDNITITYPNMDAFSADPEYYNFIVLENYDADTDTATKTDVFEKNIIKEVKKPKIETAVDALNYSLAQRNSVDLDFMAAEAGKNKDSIIRELLELDLIFSLPDFNGGGDVYAYAEEYLSGEVRDKLAYAKRLAENDSKYQRNVESLEAVQPKDIPASDINTQLGSPYFTTDVIQDFMSEELNIPAKVTYSAIINGWDVRSYDKNASENTTQHGTAKRPADEIMASLLMRKEIHVTSIIQTENGEKIVVNVNETQAAQDKAKALQEKFDNWIWKSKHGEIVHRRYNQEFNNIVPRKIDGRHITVASSIPLRDHQKNAVWRVLQTGNSYFAHAVGAGKTLAMVSSAMEMRRLGLWKKPLFVVPNHMLAQFAGEFRAAYPQAKIFVADERNFHTSKRQRFVANVAKGDWDGVVMTYSSFKKVPISREFEAEMIQTEIDKYRLALQESGESKSSGRGSTASRIEKQIEKMESRLKGLKTQDIDGGFSFDQLGTDAILLDEAHYFRKLSFNTMQGNMKGVNPIGSKAAWDLYVKSKYLDTIHPSRNLVMASGTPLTNTLAEVFTIQRFMNERALVSRGIATFDAWSSVYAASVTNAERQPSGAYKNVTRLAEFRNLNSLSQMVRDFMDVVTSDELGSLVDRPTMKTGSMIIRTKPPSREYLAFQKYLAQRTQDVAKKRGGEKGADNILSIINEGRHAAIDMRLIDPTLPESPSKLEDMIDMVSKIYNDTANDEFTETYRGARRAKNKGGAQLIFSDLGVRSRTKEGKTFSAYDHIRRKLIRSGIPADEIAFISDYETTEEKRSLQNKVRSGDIRILIGSTAKMGTGLNVQNRLKAVHNLDAPWLPADLEQRTGRALRQGNQYGEIEIYGYGTEGSYDSTMWGMLETKAKAIIQFLKGDGDLTTMRDIEETDHFRMAKAMTSGDERVLKQAELESDVEKLSRQAKNFTNEQIQIKSGIAGNKNTIESGKQRIKDAESALKLKKDFVDDNFLMSINGTPYAERAEASGALEHAVKLIIDNGSSTPTDGVKIADYRGFEIKMFASVSNLDANYELFIDHPVFDSGKYKNTWNLGEIFSGSGAITRINNAISRLDGVVEESKAAIARAEREIKVLESQITDKFSKEDELRKKRSELAEIEKDLRENAPVEVTYDDYPLDYWAANKNDINNPSFYILGDEDFTYADNVDGTLSEEISGKLNKVLRGVGFPNANIVFYETTDQLVDLIGKKPEGLNDSVQGFYWRGIIFASMQGQDIVGTINHEIIHALKSFGAFTESEWSVLRARAKQWREKYKIDSTYAEILMKQGYTDPARLEAKLDEEAIAHAFQDFEIMGIYRRIANRAVKFIKTIGDVLRGRPYNFTSAEDVFEAVKSGKVAARKPQAAALALKKGVEQFTQDRRNLNAAEDFPSFSLPKAKKAALDKATQTLATVRGLENGLIKDITRIAASALHPHQIATLYKEFTPVYLAIIERMKQREVIVHSMSKDITLYSRLNKKSKKNVHAVLEIGRLRGATYKPDSSGAIIVKNTDLKDTLHSKQGDTIALTPHEVAAYLGVRTAMDNALDYHLDAILEEFNLLEKGVKTIQDVEKLRMKAVRDGNMSDIKWYKDVLKRMNEIEDAKKRGYIPFKRWGQIGVSVKDADGETVHFERVEIPDGILKQGRRMIGKNKAIEDVLERLGQKYNDKNFTINFFEMSKFEDVAANIDLRALDVLVASSEMSNEDYQRLRDILEREAQKKGFRSHFFRSNDVAGYSEDFERAINDYIVGNASYISHRLNDRKIDAAVSNIAASGKPRLYEYAREQQQYANDISEEFQTLRTMGFFWTLSGNISSGLVNATQPFLITAPWFSAKFGHAEIGVQLSKAYADALLSVDFKTSGMDLFNFEKAPADIRDALLRAYNEGDFLSLATNDAMAISNVSTQNLRGLDKTKRFVMDAIGLTFSIPEKTNRVTTFIAAYRLALNPKNQEKIKRFIRNDNLALSMLSGKTGKEFAFSYAEYAVVSTQYRVGKLNRPRIARNYGTLLFQFMSFTAQTFELMYRLNKVHGGAKSKMALGIIMLSVVAMAGLKGIPFEDDIQGLLEWLYKYKTGKDLDIDTEFREELAKRTSPFIAETLIKGIPASLLNVDLSNRLGFGNVVPDQQSDFLGVWYNLIYERPLKSLEYANSGDMTRAVAEISPAFLRNPIDAYLWSTDGVRTKKGAKVIDSSSVSDVDVAMKFFGFTPADISRERDYVFSKTRASSAVDDLRSRYYGQIAKALAERKRRKHEGDVQGADEMSQQIQAIVAEIKHYNETVPLHEKIIINDATIKRRVFEELSGADAKPVKKQARKRDKELREIYGIEE
jgi:N12 class adenine-specific DNA methylase